MFEKKEDRKKEDREMDRQPEAARMEEPKPITTVAPNLSFTFILKGNMDKLDPNLFFEGERAIACYKTIRDYAIFTNKRIILKDVEGITGTKVNITVIPYNSIKMYSVESAGIVGIDADVVLWTTIGRIQLHLNRGIDANELLLIIAEKICK